jgi:hypothetical protein
MVWSRDSNELASESGTDDNTKCSASWVNIQLKRLDPKKSSGPDDIPALFLKQLAPVLSTSIATLVTRSWKEGNLPDDWKKATVIPVPKTGPSPHPSDYHPISLTRIIGKIAERFVLDEIFESIDNQLPSQQFGFRKRASYNGRNGGVQRIAFSSCNHLI